MSPTQLMLLEEEPVRARVTADSIVVPSAIDRRCYTLRPHHVRLGLVDYNPRDCRRLILAATNPETFKDSIYIYEAVPMHIDAVGHMLDLLVRWGRLERTEMYHTWNGESRFIKPAPRDYHGFSFGYRHNTGHDRPAASAGTVQGLVRLRVDRQWRDYPIGTRAYACNGGWWERVDGGWKPNVSKDVFPSPGGDAVGECIELPNTAVSGDGPQRGGVHSQAGSENG